jgi:hypothetical protein
MRIVVSDTSCLIDLRKVSLLDSFLKLPYEILIPNTLFDDEHLKFSGAQWWRGAPLGIIKQYVEQEKTPI